MSSLEKISNIKQWDVPNRKGRNQRTLKFVNIEKPLYIKKALYQKRHCLCADSKRNVFRGCFEESKNHLHDRIVLAQGDKSLMYRDVCKKL